MYQVLARKYRPRNFHELVGQHHVSRALTSALERGRLHHAYLFTGTRGVGKTTIARILAKCLNCEIGVTATPCECCAVCTAVNEGRFIDLIEIDAASRTRVEDTRELLDNVPYAPTQGRYKVYLIDEVHMLSTHSFNALLKTLEEPPEHVKFLFATTDPQKLPITIISRCLQFSLRPLSKDEISQHLQYLLDKEHIHYQTEALWQLAESAQGSLRDALSLTDQAIAYGQGKVETQDVKEMLGLIDRQMIVDLLWAIHQNQRAKVAEILTALRMQAIDVTHVLEQFIQMLHDMALSQCLDLKYHDPHIDQALMAQIDPQDLQLYYQIAVQGRADLSLAMTPEQGFEMCILRLLAFSPLPAQHGFSKPSHEIQRETATVTELSHTLDHTVHQRPYLDSEKLNTDMDYTPQKSVGVQPEDTLIQDEMVEAKDHEEHVSLFADETWSNGQPQQDKNEMIADAIPHEIEIKHQPRIEVLNTYQEDSQGELSIKHIQHDEESLQHEKHDDYTVAQQPIMDITEISAEEATETLEGQWTLPKWEYWINHSTLHQGMKDILQNTVMQGDIAGQSTLIVPPQYEMIMQRWQPQLQEAVGLLNGSLQLNIIYENTTLATPLHLHQQRIQSAKQQAEQQMRQHSFVQQLQKHFSIDVVDIQLK